MKIELYDVLDVVRKSMKNGELTPFQGNYVKWLTDIGLISQKPTDVSDVKK